MTNLVRATLTALLPVLALASFAAGAADTPTAVVSPAEVGLDAERLARIGELVDRHVEAGDIAGAVTLVAKDGQIAHLEAHGLMDLRARAPMQQDAIFRIASMSKPVGAVAILMLIEEGKIHLTDPVSRFIPSFTSMQVGMSKPSRAGAGTTPNAGQAPDFYTVPAEHDITILDLLTHTSGLMSGAIGNTVGREASQQRHEQGVAWTEALGDDPLDFQPGSRWAYSALAGFDVLSRVVEIVSGQTFAAFLDERVFLPLDMTDTFFWPSPGERERLATSYVTRDGELVPREDPDSMSGPQYFSAAGGLMTTARDYAQFALMLANGGELNGQRLLSPRAVELMSSAFVADTLPGRPPGEGFGLGVRVVTDPVARHTWIAKGSFGWSGFYGTHFWIDPQNNLVAILLAQTSVRSMLDDFETAVMQAVID